MYVVIWQDTNKIELKKYIESIFTHMLSQRQRKCIKTLLEFRDFRRYPLHFCLFMQSSDKQPGGNNTGSGPKIMSTSKIRMG